jgi:hypothetical protein
MADIKISELTQAESLSTSDLLESAVPYNGGFLSRRMSLAQLSNYLENYVLHQALDTTTKTIVGAINEVLGDLANYYKKTETYSKTEVDTLIAGVSGLHFEVVQQLPTSDIDMNTIYLVPKQDSGQQDVYDEFICLDNTTTPATWEKIGTTEIDLSDYVTDTELETILNDYVTSSGLSTILANYATTSAMTTALADKVDKVSGKGLSTEDYTTAEKTKVNGLATVATSGSYNDLSSKPTIPTVNNNTISITQNGTAVDSFTLNQNSNKTIDVKDEKVKQTAISSSSNANYRLLLSKSASDAEETDGVYKDGGLYYNPYDEKLTAPNVSFSTAFIANLTVTNLVTSQYYFNLGSGSAVAMLEANSASTTSNPTFVTLPASSGTLALQSDLPTNPVLWSENNVLGAKNLIPINTTEKCHTQNNVQFTLNEDGSIKAHITGTGNGGQFDVTTKTDKNLILPNGTYIFSGCPSGGSSSTYRCRVRVYNITTGTESSYGFETGSGLTITVNETEGKGIIEIACLIYSGYNGSDLLFKPMIRPSSIADDTYVPYAQTNRQLTINKAEVTDLEDAYTDVYNLLHQPYYDQIENKVLYRGITWEVGSDNVKISGTATGGNSYYVFRSWQDGYCPNKNEVYHLEGCPSGGSTNTYYLVCQFVNSSGTTISYAYDFGNGVDFVLPDGTTSISIIFYVKANYAISGTKTVTPKLTVARKFPTYQIGTIENGANASRAYAKNELMIWLGDLYRVTTAISSGGAISGKVTATTLSAEIKAIRDALDI